MAPKQARDIEKTYSAKEFADKLRRFADSVELGKAFQIQIAGERLRVPADAEFNIEHERSGGVDEIEFQVRWKPQAPKKG